MTSENPPEVVNPDIEKIAQIDDPVERAQTAGRMQERLQNEVTELSHIRREAIDDLLEQGWKAAHIARELGLTRGRLSKITATGAGPERALIAPRGRVSSTITVAVAEKVANEQRRSSIVDTTVQAAMKIQTLAHRWNMDTRTEVVSVGGEVDLNRDHLIVMIGPRITPLVAQAISADPSIKWRRDDHGHWYMTDIKTGLEYHSDFDHDSDGSDEERTCYAHMGRIERPDREGSFLYLGGIHAPGSAGAAEVLCRDIATLWEQARRGLWSCVVKTVAGGEGKQVLRAEIVTPIHVRSKR
ncbi:hypothetical protein ACWDRB_62925 [Nonomuraea sp. NPDC003707]